MEFGPLLKARRGKMTQDALADAVRDVGHRVRVSQLSAYERQEYKPKDVNLVRALERVLGCPGELVRSLGWDAEPDPDDTPPGGVAALKQRLDEQDAMIVALAKQLHGNADADDRERVAWAALNGNTSARPAGPGSSLPPRVTPFDPGPEVLPDDEHLDAPHEDD